MLPTLSRFMFRSRAAALSPARGMLCGLALAGALSVPAAHASQAEVHVVEGLTDLLGGDFDGASIDGLGVVRAGPPLEVLADTLPGTPLALCRGADGALYVAVQAPGRVYRVAKDKKPELVVELERALITALLPYGPGKLVALTAPDGGAEIIDVAAKSHTLVAAKDVKLLLGGAVLDGVLYAAGGGDEGVLLRLMPGQKAFEVLARTDEPQLRTVAARKVNGKLLVVAGGSEEGIVYALAGSTLRALVDAAPAEITGLGIAADGTVFAAAVDTDGKLSKGATARAKDDAEDDEHKGKKQKARKVKGAELWRIDAGGRTKLLWQSKDQGAYALAVDEANDATRVLLGTGPEGRLIAVDGAGSAPAGVLTRAKGRDELVALLQERDGLTLATAHGPGVLQLGRGAVQKARYESPPFDAEAAAHYGRVAFRGDGPVTLAVRTGNTKEPGESWSAWGDADKAPPGQYAQVRAELAAGASVSALELAYLVDNRAPEIQRVDVLAPGWKVVANPREPPETRSVTFGDKPFAKFLDRRGGQNPTLEERPFGKQSFDLGYRTVYAYAEDADKDALRYRFSLGLVGKDGAATKYQIEQEWSDQPFYSFEASRLADGTYRVRVEIDDVPTNGGVRALRDRAFSAPFVVSHAAPTVKNAQAVAKDGEVHLTLEAAATLPLTVVRCAIGGEDWMPLDPIDGITDEATESYDVKLPGLRKFAAVSCELYDAGMNFARVDVPLK